MPLLGGFSIPFAGAWLWFLCKRSKQHLSNSSAINGDSGDKALGFITEGQGQAGKRSIISSTLRYDHL